MIKCSFCQTDKETDFFYKNKSSKTGFDHVCKICRKERYDSSYAAHKEYNQKYDKERRKTNKRKQFLLEYKPKKYQKKSYLKKDYKYRAREVLNRVLNVRNIKRSKKVQDMLGFTFDEFKTKFENIPKGFEIDHKIPVSWFLEHSPISIINNLDNLQLLKRLKNLKKFNRYSDEVNFDYYRKALPYIKRQKRLKLQYY